MASYSYFLFLHIISAFIWLSMIPADLILSGIIKKNDGKPINKDLVSAWLKILNLTGMIGLTGILISGIALVVIHPVFTLMDFSSNHWLVSKQVITVLLIVLTGMKFIPIGKKVRLALADNLSASDAATTEAVNNIKTLSKLAKIMAALLVVNFLFGTMHSILQIF